MAKNKISMLISKLKIADADEAVVRMAVTDKSVGDFEDGLEYYSAMKVQCERIITEDVTDFHFSNLEVLTAIQFLEKHIL